MTFEPIRTHVNAGSRYSRSKIAACSVCAATEVLDDNRPHPDPNHYAIQQLKGRGWSHIGLKRQACPTCTAKAKADSVKKTDDDKKRILTPAQKRAAYCAISNIPKKETPSVVKAETPRTATREDNRRINDELDARYDVEAQCYRQNFSDATLSAQLSVPRSWVADVRERFFGPDISALKKEAPAKIAGFEARLKDIEDRALSLASEAESERKALKSYLISLDNIG